MFEWIFMEFHVELSVSLSVCLSVILWNLEVLTHLKIKIFDQDWADHAVVCKYRDMVMNKWSTVFYS